MNHKMFFCVIASLARNYLVSIVYLLYCFIRSTRNCGKQGPDFFESRTVWQTQRTWWVLPLLVSDCATYIFYILLLIFSHCCLVFTLSVTIDPHECAKNIFLFISYLWKKKIVLCCIMFSSEYDWAFLKLSFLSLHKSSKSA